jgi:hypothetical protein
MQADLSEHHRLLTGLFIHSNDDDRSLLSTGQIESFERDGFVIGIPLLVESHIVELRREMEILMQPRQVEIHFSTNIIRMNRMTPPSGCFTHLEHGECLQPFTI